MVRVARANNHKMIMDVAKAILVKDGHEAVTARNIANKANCAVGTIYVYFENINDLLLQINCETIDNLHEKLNNLPDSRNKVLELCEAYIDFAKDNPELWGAVMNYRRTHKEKHADFYTKKINLIINLVETIILPYVEDRKALRPTVYLLWASLNGLIQLTSRDGFEKITVKEAKKMLEIMVKRLFI